ncbi:hypothetical protein QBC35DRAFT_491901 [Podospora australis]|uniref:Altered inheritance of mitochondria protein 19 n=1 Tax=Podospora australis TaxID=1536484 RepID=A0AAN6WXM9_9PEZI|nr:hypothetical protein QBC35DRAFT_491901 [Podospora australis]
MAPSSEHQSPLWKDLIKAWGTSSIPSMTLSSLALALHFRPLQLLPALFTPLLAFSSYLTLAGFKIDGAGMTAAWSGMYVLLASRRKPPSLRTKFSLRGGVRATAMGLGIANTIAGGYVYATGDRKAEEEERKEINRWGMYKDDDE